MNKLSYWAKQRPQKSRLIIVTIHFALFFIALFIAQQAMALGITVPAGLLFIPALLAFAAFAFYPRKPAFISSETKQRFISGKRAAHLLIGGIGFLMYVMSLSSHNPFSSFHNRLEGSRMITVKTGDTSARYMTVVDFGKYYYSKEVQQMSDKEKRKILKKQLMGITKDPEKSNGAKVALIILSVLVAAGLLYLLAALSCSIACSGSGTVAWIVFILGTIGILILLAWVIRGITGKRRRRKRDPVPDPQ